MKLKIELDSEDAMELLTIHASCIEIMGLNIAEHPSLYFKAAGVFNRFFVQVLNRLPTEDLDRITAIKKVD